MLIQLQILWWFLKRWFFNFAIQYDFQSHPPPLPHQPLILLILDCHWSLLLSYILFISTNPLSFFPSHSSQHGNTKLLYRNFIICCFIWLDKNKKQNNCIFWRGNCESKNNLYEIHSNMLFRIVCQNVFGTDCIENQ